MVSSAFKRGAPQAFPQKLFNMISDEDDDAIGWSESGNSFYLKPNDDFIKKVLPRYFRHSNYSSFQRQLNLYGFHKELNGLEAGMYRHPMFSLHHRERVSQIKRTPQYNSKTKGKRNRSSSNDDIDRGYASSSSNDSSSSASSFEIPVVSESIYTEDSSMFGTIEEEYKPSQGSVCLQELDVGSRLPSPVEHEGGSLSSEIPVLEHIKVDEDSIVDEITKLFGVNENKDKAKDTSLTVPKKDRLFSFGMDGIDLSQLDDLALDLDMVDATTDQLSFKRAISNGLGDLSKVDFARLSSISSDLSIADLSRCASLSQLLSF